MDEVLLITQAYRQNNDYKIEIFKQQILASAHIARQQAYISYCLATPDEKRIPIYEMWSLEGDPTKEEIEKMKQEEAEETQRAYEEGQRMGLQWIEQYKQKGMLN